MGKVIVIGSQKGGVGKTTTTLNLAYSLKEMGKKVLMVDFDSQANLTTCYGIEDTGALEYTIGHLMMALIEEELPEDFEDYIQNREGVDYIPSSIYLSVVDAKLRTEMGAERMLAEVLEPLKSRYDYILIDTCPSLGMLTINAWAIPKFFAETVLKTKEYRDKLPSDQFSYDKWYQGNSSPRNHWSNMAIVSSRGHGVACLNAVYYQEGKFALGNILCGVTPHDNSGLSAKFLYYYLNLKKDTLIVPLMKGGANVSLTVNSLKTIKMPIPPLEVQMEVIRLVDKFEELISALESELEERWLQYEYYRNSLFEFRDDIEVVTLKDICKKICSGGTPKSTNKEYYDGDIPWLRTQEVDWDDIYDTGVKITQKGLDNSSAKWIPANCLITLPDVVEAAIQAYREDNDWLGQFLEECCEMDPSYNEKSGELYQAYRAHCMQNGEYIRSTTDFYSSMDKAGYNRIRKNTGVQVVGLKLKEGQDFLE